MDIVTRNRIGTVALTVLLALAACATGTPEQAEYDRQDRRDRLLDDYYRMKAACRSNGLAVVVRQNAPERCSGRARRANGGFCPPEPGDRVLGCRGR